jgi:hypothetical protein
MNICLPLHLHISHLHLHLYLYLPQSIGIAAAPKFSSPSGSARTAPLATQQSKSRATSSSPALLPAFSASGSKQQSRVGEQISNVGATPSSTPAAVWADEDLEDLDLLLDDDWA